MSMKKHLFVFRKTPYTQSTLHIMIIFLRLHCILCNCCLPISFQTLTVSQFFERHFLSPKHFIFTHVLSYYLLLFLVYYLSLLCLTLSLCFSVYLSVYYSLSLSLFLSEHGIVIETGRVVKLAWILENVLNPTSSTIMARLHVSSVLIEIVL